MSSHPSPRVRTSLQALASTALLLLATVTAATTVQAATAGLDTRIRELRSELADAGSGPDAARRRFLRQQLLISFERRRDLERLGDEVASATVPALPEQPSDSLLALDDLRQAKQQADTALDVGRRRTELLRSDRAAAAQRLARSVAELRQAGMADSQALARLEAELAESVTAELDTFIAVSEKQQQATQARADALAQRLAQVGPLRRPSEADVVALDVRLSADAERLQAHLAAAAAIREQAQSALTTQTGATPEHLLTLKEQLVTGDFAIELAREAWTNHATREAAWRLALSYWRDGDAAAPVMARERAPAMLAALQRRIDYLGTVAELVLGQIGALDTRIARAGSEAQVELKAQRTTLQDRLAAIQATLIDQRSLVALIERLRADFEQRGEQANWRERGALAWAATRALAANTWNWELFTIEESVDVDGRKTTVPRGVTVAKLVKAPLLLLVGLYLAFRFTAWSERRARRRGVDEARARLVRRWTLGLLALGWLLLSLVLAGIPLAAFAFAGGAIAIGVGFGMQTLLKNLISGMIVLIERPFRLGDQIEMGGLRGTVVDISLRTSVLRDGDGSETLVPNSVLIDNNVKNYTFRSRLSRQKLSLVVAAGSDTRAVTDALREAAQRHGQLAASKEPQVYLDDITTDGLLFTLHYWIELGTVDRGRVASDLRLMALGALADAGVRLAEPALDVRLARAPS